MRFFCLRIPHFPAWAVAQADPSLHGRPFAVCERGQVVAVSPTALNGGIASGMSLTKANSRLASLVIVNRDHSCENEAWHEVQRTLSGLTQKIDAIEPGLLFCEIASDQLTPLLGLWNKGNYGVAAGSAGDRATAHLAAMQASGGTCRNVKEGRDWSFAGKVSITSLRGEISPQAIQCLAWFGWNDLAAVRQLSRSELTEEFEEKGIVKDAHVLYQLAQGAKSRHNLRPIPTWQPREEISARIEFELPARESEEWTQALTQTLKEACEKLGDRTARSIEITAQTPITPVTARKVLTAASNSPENLLAPAQSVLEEALRSILPLPSVVCGFEIRLGGLTNDEPLEESRWETTKATRQNRLSGALELMEQCLPGKTRHDASDSSLSPGEAEVYGWNGALQRLGLKRQTVRRGAPKLTLIPSPVASS